MSALKLALRQGFAYQRPLLAVGVTILVAVTVLAATPIYFSTLKELSLRHTLQTTNRPAFHLQVVLPVTPLEREANARLQPQITQSVARTMGWLLHDQRMYVESKPLPMSRLGTRPVFGPGADPGYLQSFPDFEGHIQVLEGRLPSAAVTYVDGWPHIEAVIGALSSGGYGLRPGDTILLNERRAGEVHQLGIHITGIVAPIDPDEDFWVGLATTVLGPVITSEADLEVLTEEELPPVGFLTLQDPLMEAVTAAFPGQPGNSILLLYTDLDSITVDTLEETQTSFARLAVELNSILPRALILTQLDTTLARLETRFFFSRIPLLSLTLVLETAILYVLIMVSHLLIEAQRESTVLVASRGGSPLQVLLVYGAQGAFLGGLSLLLGPPLAALGVTVLGVTPPFAPVTGGALLPFRLEPSAYLWGLAGAGISVALLAILGFREMRVSPIRYRQERGRPAGPLLIQRYYIDVFLIAIAGLFLWNLTQEGPLVSQSGLGTLTVDQTMMATPVVFLAALLLTLLRLFPLFLRVAAWASARLLPPWAHLGLSQMGRRPLFYNQLLLLVVLVVTLGWFGATFGATLERSSHERVLYRTGVDFSIHRAANFPLREIDDLESYFSRIPGVQSVSTAFSGSAGVGTGVADFSLLAVDSRSAANLYWFREDFSPASFTELMVSLGAAPRVPPGNREVPLDATSLRMWVKPDKPYPGIFLWAVFRDGVGAYQEKTFGELDFEGWRLLEAPLGTAVRTLDMVPPAILTAVEVYQPTFRQGTTGRILLDGLHVVTSSGQEVVLEGFENLAQWTPIATSPTRTDTLLSVTQDTKEGRRAAAFRFGRETVNGRRGFFFNELNGPIPIHVNPGVLDRMGIELGDQIILSVENVFVPVVIQRLVSHFPTVNPTRPFVIAPLDPMLDYMNLVKGGAPVRPNQILLDLPDDPQQRQTVRATMEERGLLNQALIADRQEQLNALALDPLAVVGWRGLVFASFAVLLVVIMVGYLSHSFLVAQDRRLETGIVRALGIGRGEVLRWVLLENALVLTVGSAVGAWAGLQLSRLMIPLMSFTEGGREIIPPFLIETSWTALGILLAGLLGGVALTTGLVGVVLARVSPSRVLRRGEV